MSTGRFVTVFDLSTAGFKDWDFAAVGLIFIAIGLAVFFFPLVVRRLGFTFLDFKSRMQKFFRYAFLGFALFWTVTSFAATYGGYLKHRAVVADNRCRIVEGAVENFVPMPYEGHGYERFTVAGVGFAYSDYVVSDGFNNTASHGGPIRAGQTVRICYDPSDQAILRLAIRDFKGPVPVPPPATAFAAPVSTTETDREDGGDAPWYANLFIVAYILDIAGLVRLYPPYLRTFIRLKSVVTAASVSPAVLDADRRTKLRNGMVRWDVTEQALWLRPRGFNLFQVPFLAAKLDVTAGSVTRYEIRFSSGLLAVLALFLFSAFENFSHSMPEGAAMAGPLVGIAAVFSLVVGAFRLTMLRRRMDTLVADALVELKTAV